jgi:hypothetical protein
MKRWLFCLLSACALHFTVSAHVLDQYLQVTQIALAPNNVRLELRLIPGIQVADRICGLIDVNGDGQISKAEEQAYAVRVLQDIELTIGEVKTPLTLTDIQFPSPSEMREGLGTIRLTLEASATLSTARQLYFHNNHLPELGVYLVNALMPTTNEIQLGGQERDPLQRGLRLDFQVTQAGTQNSLRWIGVLLFFLCLVLLFPQWKHMRLFLRQLNNTKMDGKKPVS